MNEYIKQKIKLIGNKVGHFFPITWINILYFIKFKKKLNLKNPNNLNEKILYLSLKTDTSQWSNLADKFAVRNYVEKAIGTQYLTKLYQVVDNPDNINFSLLPDKFVIKTNHGSGDIIIVKDRNSLDINNIKYQLKKNLKPFYGNGSEKHYERIEPKIVIEEYLDNDSNTNKYSNSLIDYKCWCFNGKVKYIWVCCNRSRKGTDVVLYDIKWNPHLEYSVFNKHYRKGPIIPKPDNLTELIRICEKLSQPFPVVRVDLYIVRGKIYFGEMTFTSLGGLMDYFTDEFLNHAGSMIDLNYNP